MVRYILMCLFFFSSVIQAAEEVKGSKIQQKYGKKKTEIARLYESFKYEPIWLDGSSWNARAENLLEAIQKSGEEGLNPKEYAKLEELMKTEPEGDDAQGEADVEATKVLIKFSKDLLQGRLSHLNKKAKRLGKAKPFNVVDNLIAEFKSNPSGRFLKEMTINLEGYQRLKELLAEYKERANDADWPKYPAGKSLKVLKLKSGKVKYPSDNRVKALRKILIAQGDMDGGDTENPVYDEAVVKGVEAFQKRHNIVVDGIVGPETTRMLNLSHKDKIERILLAMERWRWMPKQMKGRFVIVNIPGFHLTAYEAGKKKFDMNIIVGKRYRKTPTFSSEIYSVRFNPSWHIPPGIFRKDKLPKIMRDPSYVNRKGYVVYDRYSGRRLNPHNVDWGAGNVKLVQPPGNRNALGKIRFTLKTTNSIYLHGTPQQHLFKKKKRTFSSGCIRVEDPQKLAVYMFNDESKWPLERIETESSKRKTKNVPLGESVPVHIVYLTVWVDDEGNAFFADDVYGRDRILVEQIRQIHYDDYIALVDIEELFREEEEDEETIFADSADVAKSIAPVYDPVPPSKRFRQYDSPQTLGRSGEIRGYGLY